MDPVTALGLGVNIVQLVELSGQILLRLCKYYIDVKDAGKHALVLRNEVGYTLSLVNALAQELNAGNWKLLASDQAQFSAALERFRQVLESLGNRTGPNAVTGIGRLKWPFKKEENERLLAEIYRCKSSFNFALNIGQRYDLYHLSG
jgi:hypothetical protein